MLIFADDLFVMCKGEKRSIALVLQGLQFEFKYLGLSISISHLRVGARDCSGLVEHDN